MNKIIHTKILEALSHVKKSLMHERNFYTPFHTSLILLCLKDVHPSSKRNTLIELGVKFLLSQKSVFFTWNYWNRTSDNSKTLPDDWDDTAVALTAITIHNPEYIDEQLLLLCVHNLIASETCAGGPYFTWMIPKHLRAHWDDVDIVVNSNIAHFLTTQNIHLDSLTAYIEKCIEQDYFPSSYYSPLVTIYFISKWYRGKHQNILKDKILSMQNSDGVWGNILETSLMVSAWLNLGGACKEIYPSVELLVKTTRTDWVPYPLYIEEIKSGIPIYSGSSALTAAFIIEALSLYNKKIEQARDIEKETFHKNITNQIIEIAKEKFSHLPTTMQHKLDSFMEKILHSESSNEIFLTTYFIYTSLLGKNQPDGAFVLQLCAANLLGWIGYTIYDDILDGDGAIQNIPFANICVRETAAMFGNHSWTKQILDGIDIANTWESNNCIFLKIPTYDDITTIAYKSLGHAIGPMSIMQNIDDANYMKQFFIHYLTARQLNDDAHDWFVDLEKGYVNPIGSKVLEKFKKMYPGKSITAISEIQNDLQSIFWNSEINWAAEQIFIHTNQARGMLTKISCISIPFEIISFIEKIERSAEKALFERNKTQKFLSIYNS